MLTIRVLLALVSSDDPGPLSTPQIPKIRGLDQFEGAYFHNLRWDPTVDFKNKRVAVVGNGSSGIQLIVRPPSSFWLPSSPPLSSFSKVDNSRELTWQPGVAEIEGVKLTQFIRSGGYFIPKSESREQRRMRIQGWRFRASLRVWT